MLYDSIVEEMLESALSQSSTDYLNAKDTKEKIITSKIFCDVTDRAIKLINLQKEDELEKDKQSETERENLRTYQLKQGQIEAEKNKNDEELQLKRDQIEAERIKDEQELKLKFQMMEHDVNKAVDQKIMGYVELVTKSVLLVGFNLGYMWFDKSGAMFTSSFGKKRADESTRIGNFFK